MNSNAFHVALVAPAKAGVRESLRARLKTLESGAVLDHLELHGGGEQLWALLAFDSQASAERHRPLLKTLAATLHGNHHELWRLSDIDQAVLLAEIAAAPIAATGSVDTAFEEFLRHDYSREIRLAFQSNEELLSVWARYVAEGELWAPAPQDEMADTFRVIFVTPDAQFDHNRGRKRLNSAHAQDTETGLWLEIEPGEGLSALLKRTREAKRAAAPLPVRSVPSVSTQTDGTLEFECRLTTVLELTSVWANELAQGTLFVPMDGSRVPALRQRVQVRFVLPDGTELRVAAEVIQRVLEPRHGGVQLTFLDRTGGAFAAIERQLEEPVHRPRVLVVDDEAIWRSTLVRMLKALDVDIVLAHDGREGLQKLIEDYFVLDLVILDLHMPHMDGRGLIDRVRRLGGEAGLQMFLFTATTKEELEALGEAGLAAEIFSKLAPLDLLAKRVAMAVGKQWPEEGVLSSLG